MNTKRNDKTHWHVETNNVEVQILPLITTDQEDADGYYRRVVQKIMYHKAQGYTFYGRFVATFPSGDRAMMYSCEKGCLERK